MNLSPQAQTRLSQALTLLVALLATILLCGQQRQLGLWEPWEARELMVAAEYATRPAFDVTTVERDPAAPGYNAVVPTLDGKPVPVSLLKTWLIAASLPEGSPDIREVVGSLERRARLPIALFTLAMLSLVGLWLRRRLGTPAALVSVTAIATLPVFYLGAHNLSTSLLSLSTTSLAIIAAFELSLARTTRASWLMAAAFATATSLAILDQRLISLSLILFTLAIASLVQLPFAHQEATPDDASPTPRAIPRVELGAALAILTLPLLYLLGMWLSAPDYSAAAETLKKPHVLQLLFLGSTSCALLAALFLGRRAPLLRTFRSPQGALALGVPTLTLGLLAHSYAGINPTLLDHGQITGSIPVLDYMFGRFVDAKSLAQQHVHFDIWLRQIGFATFPWAALIPAALANLARAMRHDASPEAEAEHPHRPAIKRLLLVWAMISLPWIALASAYHHELYPGYVPLAIACGILLTDTALWRDIVRHRPALGSLIGLTAVAIILTVGKDLERYPHRLIELYAQMPQELSLPEGFSWGSAYKPMKYAMALLLIAGFFGPISAAALSWRDLPLLRQRWRDWRVKKTPLFAPFTPPDSTPLAERAQARAALLEGDAPSPPASRVERGLSALARLFERPLSRALLICATFGAFAMLTLFTGIGKATYHLSQRHIFDTYVAHSSPEQPLVGYMLPAQRDSLYLRDMTRLTSTAQLTERMAATERFFAVIPRDKLAQLNADVRRELKRNLNVLDARSSQLVLISNQLSPGQEDKNFIAERIIDPTDTLPAEVQHEVKYPDAEGKQVYATFDEQLQLLGYSLDKKGQRTGDGAPRYKWGEDMELTLYFRVLKRVPGNQQLFVHIDTRGNRLSGDHFPLGGEHATSTWLPGDIVKDVHPISITNYSKVGTYSINFGFYVGSNRMKVAPPKAHDGSDRVSVGQIIVTR